MVRPSGFEPPTFCSGGKGPMCILLTYLAAMACFKVNRGRTKAAVDERLMKGFQKTTFQNHSSTPFSQHRTESPIAPHEGPTPICGVPYGPSLGPDCQSYILHQDRACP